MNIYKAIEHCVSGLPDSGYHSDNPLNTAVKDVKALVAAYNALAPTPEMWAAAPETTQWYTLDANGRYSAYESEPHWTPNEPDEWEYTQRWIGQHIDIPLGVDWRLCKWQRPA